MHDTVTPPKEITSEQFNNHVRDSKGVYSDSGEYCGEAIVSPEGQPLPTAAAMREYVDRESRYRAEMNERIHGKRMKWRCPHHEDCFVDDCWHREEHEFDEDCEGDHWCSRGIITDSCVRVGGPKHKRITEGRCDSIWEE